MTRQRNKSKSTSPLESRSETAATQKPWFRRWDQLPAALVAAIAVAAVLFPTESVGQGTAIPLQLAALTACGLWIASYCLSDRRQIFGGWPDVLGGLFLAWLTLSAVRMASAGQARVSINVTWAWWGGALVWFVARQALRSPRVLRAFVALHLSLAVALTVYGLYQCWIVMPQDRAAFREDPDAVLRAAGIVAPEGSPLRKQFADRLESPEPLATFALTNSLAAYLLPWWIMGVGLVVTSQRENTDKQVTGAFIVVSLLIAVCLVLTKSRSAYVGAAVGLAALALFTPRVLGRGSLLRSRTVLVAASVLGACVVAACIVDPRILSEARKSLGYRWEYWQATLSLLKDYPLTGCGPGNFQVFYTSYKLPQSSETVADPHNFAFEIAAIAGWPALMFWGAAAVVWLITVVRRPDIAEPSPKMPDAEAQPSYATVLMGAVGGLILGGVAGVSSGYPPPLDLLLLGGLPAGVVLWALGPWVAHGRLPRAWLVAGIAAQLVCLLAAGGIGYPAVSLSIWLLAAFALNLTSREAPAANSPPELPVVSPTREMRPAPRWLGYVMAFSWLVILTVFYVTCYRPVFTGRSQLLQGDQAAAMGDLADARAWYQQAATSDPWSAAPWKRQADVAHHAWLATGDKGARREFERVVLETIQREPHSQLIRQEFARSFLAAYRRLGDATALTNAIAMQRDAIQLYPNGAMVRAQAAWLLHLAGDAEAARVEAERALALDDLHSHGEQKLANQTLVDYPPGTGVRDQVSTRPAEQKARECLEREVLRISGKQ